MRSRISEGSSESHKTTAIQSGDLVLLAGEGCNQPARQLMAIWTVKSFAPEHRIRVYINPDMQLVEGLASLGEKAYSRDWLVLYRRQWV